MFENLSLELWGIIVTLFIFVSTQAAQAYNKSRDRKRLQKSIEFVFACELDLTYSWLGNALSALDSTEDRHAAVCIVASVTSQLSTLIFDNQLTELRNLSPKRIEKIYDAYAAVTQARELAEEFLARFKDLPIENKVAYALAKETVIVVSRATHSSIGVALSEWHGADFESKSRFPSVNYEKVAGSLRKTMEEAKPSE